MNMQTSEVMTAVAAAATITAAGYRELALRNAETVERGLRRETELRAQVARLEEQSHARGMEIERLDAQLAGALADIVTARRNERTATERSERLTRALGDAQERAGNARSEVTVLEAAVADVLEAWDLGTVQASDRLHGAMRALRTLGGGR